MRAFVPIVASLAIIFAVDAAGAGTPKKASAPDLPDITAWGSVSDGFVEISIMRFTKAEDKAMSRLTRQDAAADRASASETRVRIRIPAGSASLPGVYQNLRTATLVTSKGVKKVTVKFFMAQEREIGTILDIYTSVPKGLGAEDVLFPDQTRPYPGGSLVPVQPQHPSDVALKSLRKQLVRKARGTHMSRIVIKYLKKLQAKNVAYTVGRFPSPHRKLVTMAIEVDDEVNDEGDHFNDFNIVSALFLVDDKYKVTAWLEAPGGGWNQSEVLYLVDVDANGEDEFVLYSDGIEHSSLRLGQIRRKPVRTRGNERSWVRWEFLTASGL